MELRKAQEMGGSTLLVSLPRTWSRQNHLKKGSILAVEVGVDGRLLVFPYRREEEEAQETTIAYPAEYLERLVNQVTGAYLLGYDLILIKGKNRITYDDRESVKKATRQLVGLEIVEEDATSITLQFLLEPATLNPKKVFRRMHLIVLGMLRDTITSLLEADKPLIRVVVERDDEVDRQYFLLVRLIRTAIMNLSLAAKYDLTPLDCLDYRVAAHVLEGIGDSSVAVAKTILNLPADTLDEELKRGLVEVREKVEAMQELAARSLLDRNPDDAGRAVELYRQLQGLIKRTETQVREKPATVVADLLDVTSRIEEVCTGLIDIADLTVPLYPAVR